MYTEKEASAVKHKFWISFGQYMSPVPSASGEKVNWINYRTGIKGISFKLHADNNHAYTAVEISLPDKQLQHQYFNTFHNFRKQLEKSSEQSWQMQLSFINEYGKDISSISTELNEVNIFRENEWPVIIAFLKKNIIGLDAFWNAYKPAFEMTGY